MNPCPSPSHRLLALLAIFALTSLNFVYHWVYISSYARERFIHPQQQKPEEHHDVQNGNPDGHTALKAVLPSCPLPRPRLAVETPHIFSTSGDINYNFYADLARENSEMAARVCNITQDPNRTEEDGQARIPHRLIFTHQTNLFECSNSTSPMLYTLAENAKATVNAYGRIWDDLEYVFLTDEDCVTALEVAEPALVAWFQNPMLKGTRCLLWLRFQTFV